MIAPWKLALARSTVRQVAGVCKDVVEAVLPVRSAVTTARVVRDVALSKLGSAAAQARISHVAACLMQEPPRLPTGAELKVVSMLARRR